MDNSSIAAFIETNKTRMKPVIICLPRPRKTPHIRYIDDKKKEGGQTRGRRWESNQASHSSNRDEWRAHGIREFTQPRRRRQQESHKFAYLIVKNNSFARFARAFLIFDISLTFSFFLRREMTCFAVV